MIQEYARDCRQDKDVRAPYGVVADGWRLVRKGGRIKFGSGWWFHPLLVDVVGKFVHVGNTDYWMSELWILHPSRFELQIPLQPDRMRKVGSHEH